MRPATSTSKPRTCDGSAGGAWANGGPPPGPLHANAAHLCRIGRVGFDGRCSALGIAAPEKHWGSLALRAEARQRAHQEPDDADEAGDDHGYKVGVPVAARSWVDRADWPGRSRRFARPAAPSEREVVWRFQPRVDVHDCGSR